MTKAQRDIQRKRRVLEHAERIGNIRRTCRYFGESRSAFYLWPRAYETYGDESEEVGDSWVPGRPKWMQVEASLLD